jgi:ketosteroid isomerase-like protein
MNLEETARALDARELEAILRQDVASLARIWSEDYIVTAPDNVARDRAAVFDLVERRMIDYTETHRVVEHVRMRDGLAVSLGEETFVPAGDAPAPLHRRFTHVWVRDPEGWRLLVRHANLVSP